MRICFILDTFAGGGKERRCLQLIEGLNSKGYNEIQLIIVNDGIEYPEIYNAQVDLYIIDRKKRGISNFKTIKEIGHLISQYQPKIVMAWGLMSATFVNFLKIRSNFIYIISYIADCNAPKFPSVNYFANKLCLLLCDKAIGNSNAGLTAYKIPNHKKICIYNGFNINRLVRLTGMDIERYKQEVLGVRTKFIISMIAGVDRRKDYYSFIQVAKLILKQRDDVTFLAVGKGKMMNEMKMETNDHEKMLIRFIGFRTDVEEILSCSTLSMLLTNFHNHSEGISNSIVESMAIGVPVIATNSGGTPEIITDGETGYLVNNNDIHQTVTYTIQLLDNSEKRKQMCTACKKLVESKFSLNFTTQQYISLFEAL